MRIIQFIKIAVATVAVAFSTAIWANSHWECRSYDANGQMWMHFSTQPEAIQWAMSACRRGSARPGSCYGGPQFCVHESDSGISHWRCFARDYRNTMTWSRTGPPPRYIALNAAYRACYANSPRPKTCYISPSQCVKYH